MLNGIRTSAVTVTSAVASMMSAGMAVAGPYEVSSCEQEGSSLSGHASTALSLNSPVLMAPMPSSVIWMNRPRGIFAENSAKKAAMTSLKFAPVVASRV